MTTHPVQRVYIFWDFGAPIGNCHISTSEPRPGLGWDDDRIDQAIRTVDAPLIAVDRLIEARHALADAHEALLDVIVWDPDNGTVGNSACSHWDPNPLHRCRTCGYGIGPHAHNWQPALDEAVLEPAPSPEPDPPPGPEPTRQRLWDQLR